MSKEALLILSPQQVLQAQQPSLHLAVIVLLTPPHRVPQRLAVQEPLQALLALQ